MFEMFIRVYCAFDFEMMIWANGVFALIGGSTSMEPIDCMDVFWFGAIWACIAWGGALDTWTLLSNNSMFIFTSPMSNLWTCQTIKSNKNLENGISSSWGNSKGSCLTSSSSSSSNVVGSPLNESFSFAFSSTSNIKFSDNIFFLYHVVGLALGLFTRVCY